MQFYTTNAKKERKWVFTTKNEASISDFGTG